MNIFKMRGVLHIYGYQSANELTIDRVWVPSVKTIFHAQHLDQKQLAYKKQRHSKGVISCIYHLPETDNKHDLVLSHFLLKEILI
jgi:hypothetical protein